MLVQFRRSICPASCLTFEYVVFDVFDVVWYFVHWSPRLFLKTSTVSKRSREGRPLIRRKTILIRSARIDCRSAAQCSGSNMGEDSFRVLPQQDVSSDVRFCPASTQCGGSCGSGSLLGTTTKHPPRYNFCAAGGVQPLMRMLFLVLVLILQQVQAQIPPDTARQVQNLLHSLQWKKIFLRTFTLLGPHHGCMTICNDQHTRACTNLIAEGIEWEDLDVGHFSHKRISSRKASSGKIWT